MSEPLDDELYEYDLRDIPYLLTKITTLIKERDEAREEVERLATALAEKERPFYDLHTQI